MSNAPDTGSAPAVDRLAAVRARFRTRLAEERGDLSSGVLGEQAVRDMVHRMAGLAGTLGAGGVSAAAKRYELEPGALTMAGLLAAIDAELAS